MNTDARYRRRPRSRAHLLRASILVLFVVPATVAFAQALVSDGRALDSSLQLGTGGYNQSRGFEHRTLEVRRYDMRMSNVKPHRTSAYGGWTQRNQSSIQKRHYRPAGTSRAYAGSSRAYRAQSTRVNTRVR
ncbi:MAG: hypothetical protein ACYTF9_12365 [Planctomycetota bacterium]|jgi:hypothetical protein